MLSAQRLNSRLWDNLKGSSHLPCQPFETSPCLQYTISPLPCLLPRKSGSRFCLHNENHTCTWCGSMVIRVQSVTAGVARAALHTSSACKMEESGMATLLGSYVHMHALPGCPPPSNILHDPAESFNIVSDICSLIASSSTGFLSQPAQGASGSRSCCRLSELPWQPPAGSVCCQRGRSCNSDTTD